MSKGYGVCVRTQILRAFVIPAFRWHPGIEPMPPEGGRYMSSWLSPRRYNRGSPHDSLTLFKTTAEAGRGEEEGESRDRKFADRVPMDFLAGI